jgi:hypothetical protein
VIRSGVATTKHEVRPAVAAPIIRDLRLPPLILANAVTVGLGSLEQIGSQFHVSTCCDLQFYLISIFASFNKVRQT